VVVVLVLFAVWNKARRGSFFWWHSKGSRDS
jgi:hypothetical protein